MLDKLDHARGWLLKGDSDLATARRVVDEGLEAVCATLPDGPNLSTVDLSELTPYAVQLRYDFEFWPDLETAEHGVKVAEAVRAAVLAAVPAPAHPQS